MIASSMMMTRKKKVISKSSLSMSPAAGSRTSAMPPPERRPWSMWYTKHYMHVWVEKEGGREREREIYKHEKLAIMCDKI